MSEEVPLPLIAGAPLRPLNGSELITLAGHPIPDGSILNFWRWVAGDLRDNTLRGEFAEWLVGLLLGIDMGVRVGWAAADHQHHGIRIEVKSSAYIQGWGQRARSQIRFGALVKQPWDGVIGAFVEQPQLNADWYVFALETCKDGPSYDPLDLSQWKFYVVPRGKLLGLARGQGLSLKRVAAIAEPMSAEQFRSEGRELMGLDSSVDLP